MAQKSQDRKRHRQTGSHGQRTRARNGRDGNQTHTSSRSHAAQESATREEGMQVLREAQAALAEPTARFGELSVRTFEQVARFGYELAGEVLDLAIEQMHATIGARDLNSWMTRQGELMAGFIDRQARRTNDWVREAATSQEDITEWAASAAGTAVDQARRGTQRLNA